MPENIFHPRCPGYSKTAQRPDIGDIFSAGISLSSDWIKDGLRHIKRICSRPVGIRPKGGPIVTYTNATDA